MYEINKYNKINNFVLNYTIYLLKEIITLKLFNCNITKKNFNKSIYSIVERERERKRKKERERELKLLINNN